MFLIYSFFACFSLMGIFFHVILVHSEMLLVHLFLATLQVQIFIFPAFFGVLQRFKSLGKMITVLY